MRTLSRVFAIAVLLGTWSLAPAHPAPFSYLDIYVDGARGSIVLHDFDVAHELGVLEPSLLLNAEIVATQRDALLHLIDSRLRISSDGAPSTATWGSTEILAERQSLKLSFSLDRPARGVVTVDSLLFPYDSKHQTFVNVYEGGALRQQAILDARQSALIYYRGTVQGRWAVVKTFIEAGVHHILIGFDHVLFLVGLILLGGTGWRLAAIVTAFTVGHSVTLSLAVLDVVRVAPTIVEPAIALSIVVVGIDNLLVNRQRKRESATLLQKWDLRPWFAAFFGLIHGFGFASVLVDFGIPRAARGWSLAAFNAGVEIGQLVIVVVAMLLGSMASVALAKWFPRMDRSLVAETFLTIGSLFVIAAGVYWFAQRIGWLA